MLPKASVLRGGEAARVEEQPMAQYDGSTAQCLVFSFKDGLLSKIAHDLKHRATRFEVSVEDNFKGVHAKIDARSLMVDCVMRDGVEADGAISDSDKRKIESQIVEDVLHANKFPMIEFKSTSVNDVGGQFEIEGVVTMHGVERPIKTVARRENGHFLADLTLNQPDFGIKPFSAMMGTLKIKPEVVVRLIVPAA
jgi:polyisoprenoid-binding protein YceI